MKTHHDFVCKILVFVIKVPINHVEVITMYQHQIYFIQIDINSNNNNDISFSKHRSWQARMNEAIFAYASYFYDFTIFYYQTRIS